MMTMCYGFCVAPDYPDWCKDTLRMMKEADGLVFADEESFEQFFLRLGMKLQESVPVTEARMCKSCNLIFIEDRETHVDYAYLSYQCVKAVVKWRPADLFTDNREEGGGR